MGPAVGVDDDVVEAWLPPSTSGVMKVTVGWLVAVGWVERMIAGSEESGRGDAWTLDGKNDDDDDDDDDDGRYVLDGEDDDGDDDGRDCEGSGTDVGCASNTVGMTRRAGSGPGCVPHVSVQIHIVAEILIMKT